MAEAVDVRLLLRRYVPYLRYDSLESYRADSAAVLPEHFVPAGTGWSATNVLRRKDGTVLAAARPRAGQATLTLDFLGKGRYANGTTVRRDDLVDAVGSDYVADARRMHADPRYADVCYGSVGQRLRRRALAPVLVLLLQQRQDATSATGPTRATGR